MPRRFPVSGPSVNSYSLAARRIRKPTTRVPVLAEGGSRVGGPPS